MIDRRPGYTPPVWRIINDPLPFAELAREDLTDAAMLAVKQRDAIGRERDSLAVANAVLRERLAHLEHKPVRPAYAARVLDDDSDDADEWYSHLVDRRRAAEGADMPADDSAEPNRLPLGWCVMAIFVAAVILWAFVLAVLRVLA